MSDTIMLDPNQQAFLEALRTLTIESNVNTAKLSAGLEALAARSGNARVGDVDTFDGTDSTKYRGFISQLTVYFSTQSLRFPDDRTMINYTGNRLRGAAQEWFARNLSPADLIGTTGHVWFNWTVFQESMRDLFGRRNEDHEIRRQLEALRQDGRGVTEYLNEFERLQGMVGDTEGSKGFMFRNGLDGWIKERMTYFPYDTYTYEGAKTSAMSVYQAAQEAKADRLKYQYRKPQPPRSYTQPSTVVVNSYRPPSAAVTSAGGDAMEIDAVQRRGPLTPDEKAHRMKNNLCLYCGKEGHKINECSLRNRSGPARSSPVPGN